MKPKLIYILFYQILIVFSFSQSSAQPERYIDSLFNINILSDITYGSNYDLDGNLQSLEMDIYMPVDDPIAERPLIIFAHGGSFLYGFKINPAMIELCTRFAQMGYVTASIEYRLGIDIFSFDPEKEFTYAVLRATHDMRAAVRFFRKDASTTNDFGIDTNLIFAGGSSAGAFTALHMAYLDQLSEVPEVITDIEELGGLAGNSGNPGYSDEVMGVVNLCGALGDTSWIHAGDEALVSMHGDYDQNVPYGTDMINLFGFDIMEVDGSASISERAENVDLNYAFHTFVGQDHVPYDPLWAPGPDQPAYMDTTVNFVKYFLYEIVTDSVTSVEEHIYSENSFYLSIFPNPLRGEGFVRFRVSDAGSQFTVYSWQLAGGNGQGSIGNRQLANGNKVVLNIYDMFGHKLQTLIHMQFNPGEYLVPLDASELSEGIYFIELVIENKAESIKFIVTK